MTEATMATNTVVIEAPHKAVARKMRELLLTRKQLTHELRKAGHYVSGWAEDLIPPGIMARLRLFSSSPDLAGLRKGAGLGLAWMAGRAFLKTSAGRRLVLVGRHVWDYTCTMAGLGSLKVEEWLEKKGSVGKYAATQLANVRKGTGLLGQGIRFAGKAASAVASVAVPAANLVSKTSIVTAAATLAGRPLAGALYTAYAIGKALHRVSKSAVRAVKRSSLYNEVRYVEAEARLRHEIKQASLTQAQKKTLLDMSQDDLTAIMVKLTEGGHKVTLNNVLDLTGPSEGATARKANTKKDQPKKAETAGATVPDVTNPNSVFTL